VERQRAASDGRWDFQKRNEKVKVIDQLITKSYHEIEFSLMNQMVSHEAEPDEDDEHSCIGRARPTRSAA
jgi:hypothetical protein